MITLTSISKAQRKIARDLRKRRLDMELTQESLATRSGVALSTLRKFKQKGIISLESFLKLLLVVGGLEELITVLKPIKPKFSSIDEVLKMDNNVNRTRGKK